MIRLRQSSITIFVLLGISVLLPVISAAAVDIDSLLARSVGGSSAVDKLRRVETVYGSGTASLNGVPGTFELYVAVPDKIYFEMKLGAFAITQAFDGETAWQRDQNGMVNKLSGYEKHSLLSQAFFMTYSHLLDGRMPGNREYLGTEVREGRLFHKVAFYPLGQDTVFSYFDPESGTQRFDVMYMDNLETVTEYRDHRRHEGVEVAFLSRASIPAAQISSEVRIDSLVFNDDFDRSIFQPPESEIDYRFPEGTERVTVPFEFIAGHIYVEATVNGRRLAFILDSGASSNFFHAAAIADLGLPVVGNVAAVGMAGYDQINLLHTDSIVIGDLVLLSQVGGALDLTALTHSWTGEVPFGGILGYNFLSRFPNLVDYRAKTLTVYNPDGFAPPAGGHPVPFEYTMQIPTIEAELLGLPGRYLVDLGNAFGLIVHNDYSRKHDLESLLDDVKDVSQVIGGVGGGVRGKTAVVESFVFGDVMISNLRVMLPDSASGLSGSVELAGNIGNLLLQEFRVLFDYSGQRLVFYDAFEAKD